MNTELVDLCSQDASRTTQKLVLLLRYSPVSNDVEGSEEAGDSLAYGAVAICQYQITSV